MNRQELVKTLDLVKPALASNAMIPIFQCFTFQDGKVSAYDDAIAIVGPTEVEDTCGIHGATLLGLLSNSKAEDAEFVFKDREIVTVTLGKTVSKLPFYPLENFIFEAPAKKEAWAYKVPFTESLFDALKMCLETVSTDATQAALLGITIQGDKMYACNGDSLTRVQLKHGTGKNRVLMSTAFCNAVCKMWATLKVTSGAIRFNENWAFADFGDWSVYGRILEVKEPIDFEDLIKTTVKSDTVMTPVPKSLNEALSRARVLADPESQKTKLTVTKGKLQLLTETHMGEIKDDLVLKGHPDVTANINASHVQHALEYCDHMAVLENCIVLEKDPDVFLLVSNMN